MGDKIAGIRWRLGDAPQAFLPYELALEGDDILLERALDRTGLREAFDAEFEKTTPRWWGLWVRSPLTPHQCALLHTVLEQVECFWYHDRIGHYHFLRALRLGRVQPLHVEPALLGHVDCGCDDTFSHCPYCRNQDGIPLYGNPQGGDANAPMECPACGCIFVPTDTRWTERWDGEREESSFPYEFLSYRERARGYFLPHNTPRDHLGYQREYFWVDLWREFFRRGWWSFWGYEGWKYRLCRPHRIAPSVSRTSSRMADTQPGILWRLEGSPRAFLPCEFFTETGAALLELMIGQAGVREQFDAAFEKTTPRWWGLWVRSPLTPEQCLLLYKVFEQLEYANYYYRVQHWTFLRALSHGALFPLHAELAPPGHCDFGIRDVFGHCPYCRNCRHLHGGEATECSACGCVFFPEQTHWSEPDAEPTERFPYEILPFWERARGYLMPGDTPQGHLGYQQEYFWFDLWRDLRRRLWLHDPGWTYRLRRSKPPRGIE